MGSWWKPWRRPLDVIGLCIAGLCAAPAMFYPHGNDQALHHYLGQGILRGELPYETGISGKPVLIFVVHAIAGALFGPDQYGIRILEALCLVPMALWIARLFRPALPQQDGDHGSAAVLLFGLYYLFFDYWDISHPELWVAMMSLLGASIAVAGPYNHRTALLCGITGGAAFMLKYTGAALALPVAIACGLRAMVHVHVHDRGGIFAKLRALSMAAASYLGGVAIVFAACIAPFIAFGAFDEMWEVLYTFTVRYVKMAQSVPALAQWAKPESGGPALRAAGTALAAGLVLSAVRGSGRGLVRGIWLAALLGAALLTVWMQKRFFSYHFTVAAPLLAAALYYALISLLPLWPKTRMLASLGLLSAAIWLAPAFCTHAGYNYIAHVQNLANYLHGDISRQRYLKHFTGKNRLDHYALHEYVGQQAKMRARPGDELCARGFAPSIYTVSGMRCPSRHVMQAWPAGLPKWEPEFWNDVKSHLPRFVVTFKDRPHDIRRLRALGYKAHPMRSLYVLFEHPQRR